MNSPERARKLVEELLASGSRPPNVEEGEIVEIEGANCNFRPLAKTIGSVGFSSKPAA